MSLAQIKDFSARRKNLAVLALASFLFAVPMRARLQQPSIDYLLVEHVENLLIYNRYQQRITPEERKLIAPFSPMKILDAAAKLNDDFTPCLKIEIRGNVYYLIKVDDLELLGKNKLGMMHVYKDVIPLSDTVRLAAAKMNLITPDKKTIKLQRGKILERYFRLGQKTYVRLVGLRPQYGWIDLSDTNKYIVIGTKKTPNSDLPLTDAMQKRIQSKLIEANTALKALFAYFNAETNTRKNVPQWRFIALDRQYSCVVEPAEYAEKYPESTRYLAGDIDNILLGTNYDAAGSPGKIDIRQK